MKILFVTATRIGDAVLSTGLLSYLIDRFPSARLTIAAGPDAAPLFEDVPNLERLIALPKRRLSLHWLTLYRAVVLEHWRMVVDLRSSALAYLLWTRERKATAGGRMPEHRVRQFGRLFGLDPPPAPHLWLSPRRDAMASVLVPQGVPVLAIGPAANWRGKEWRSERFAELAHRLTGRSGLLPGARVAVLAAAHERSQALPLIASLPPQRCIDLVGKLDLLTAAAVLRHSAMFIGNDTGLMHLAAAAGTPTLGLFGPSAIAQYAPWGPNAATVETAIPFSDLFGPGFNHRTTDTLMDSLSVDAAEEGARCLWHRVSSKSA